MQVSEKKKKKKSMFFWLQVQLIEDLLITIMQFISEYLY